MKRAILLITSTLLACKPASNTMPAVDENPPAVQTNQASDQSQAPLQEVSSPCGFKLPKKADDSKPQGPDFRGGCLEYITHLEGMLESGKVPSERVQAHSMTGETLTLKVLKVGEDTDNRVARVPLYEVTYREEAAQREIDLCKNAEYDVRGLEPAAASRLKGKAIAVPGYWMLGKWQPGKQNQPVFTLACVSGVIAKCAHWGYVPWVDYQGRKEDNLAPYHHACVQAARAQYEDGAEQEESYTCSYTEIDIYDRLNINKRRNAKLSFESQWTEQGLKCMARSRWQHCDKELADRHVTVSATGCSDPVPGVGQDWPRDAVPGVLIAIASDPKNNALACPKLDDKGCPANK